MDQSARGRHRGTAERWEVDAVQRDYRPAAIDCRRRTGHHARSDPRRGSTRPRRFELIDTGGIIPNDAEMIPSEILKQARVALQDAAQIIFMIDGRTEITGADRDLAAMLRRLGKPVTLAVNKIDAASRQNLMHEFHELGFADVFRGIRPSTAWVCTNCWITSPRLSRGGRRGRRRRARRERSRWRSSDVRTSGSRRC